VFVENIGHARHVVILNDEVEVLMLTRLLADQGVHTPAPVQPDGDLALAQPPENLDDVDLGHRHAANVHNGERHPSRAPPDEGVAGLFDDATVLLSTTTMTSR
jgi:hypothetical protein